MKKFGSSSRMLFAFTLSVFFLGLFSVKDSSAQQFQKGIVSEGKDFYIGYIYPSFNKNPSQGGQSTSGFFNVFALISSFQDNNQVNISYFDASGTEVASQTRVVSAHNSIQVALDRSSMQMSDLGDKAEFKACHITSKKPVNIQYFSTGANSGGMYLALPTPALGRNYVIPSFNDNPGAGAYPTTRAENAGGYFMVIAAIDSTTVTIIPNGLTAAGNKGVHSTGTPFPYAVTLRRGQCYLVKGDGSDSYNDMSGSTVTSNKPIAVISGHEDANLGSTNGKNTDSRNFMIQQVIPAEYFASTGYVSIPLKDAPSSDPADPGYGENFRVYSFDTNNVTVQARVSGIVSPSSLKAKAYLYPEIDNVGTPSEFHSDNNGKFSVMMYDLRQQGATAPSPAPTMMTIVPMNSWKNSYIFYVPANSFEILQNYYINLIGLRSDIEKGFIQFGFNESTQLSKLTTLTNAATYTNIPNHTELEGVTYVVHPGAYYFTNTRDAIFHPLADTGSYAAPLAQVVADTGMLHGAFMVYFFGMRAIDPDRDLGDFDGDDYFFSFASPVGMSLTDGSTSMITAYVDTLCSSWHICIHDRNITQPANSGIQSVSLLDDAAGNFVRPGRKFYNSHFDPSLDPNNIGEIDYPGTDSVVCFDVEVGNPLDSSYAPIYVTDNIGNHIVLDLRYKAPQLKLRLLPNFSKFDTLQFPRIKIGDEVCSTMVFINPSPLSGKPYSITNISLRKNDGSLKISSVIPSLPYLLKPGDTVKVSVCFDAKDTMLHRDSIVFKTDCFSASILLLGQTGTALIYATDNDFGSIELGTTACWPITISNVGSLPFTLTKNWVLHNSTVFSMDPVSMLLLPISLMPGKSVNLTFCYKPVLLGGLDSTSIDWNTDIAEPYTNQIKSWSFLKGRAIKPGVVWEQSQLSLYADSNIVADSVIERINLLNKSTAVTTAINIFIDGVDASEFHILNTQRGQNPGSFDMNVGDRIWVDVVFKPDLTKLYPFRYADHHASLVATYYNPETQANDSTISTLIGTWAKSEVKSAEQPLAFTINPNPASGNSLVISFESLQEGKSSLTIFDVLGREVYTKNILQGESHLEIPLQNLSNGIYFARLASGNKIATQKFEIAR